MGFLVGVRLAYLSIRADQVEKLKKNIQRNQVPDDLIDPAVIASS
jgi:hypothetical protein